jgi:single-strand DNA-binding protein
VLVEGRLRPDPATGGPRLWTRQDGSVGASFEVVASSVQFLGSNGNGNGNGRSQHEEPDYEDEQDIPF